MIKARQGYCLEWKHEDIFFLWGAKHAEGRVRPARSLSRALFHTFTPFSSSVPSPAHLTHPSSEGDTGLSFLQHIPSSLKPCVSGQTIRPHSCMAPAKLKLNFHQDCQPGRKNRWSWERFLHPHQCPPHVTCPLKLSAPRTCALFCYPFFCSFLPCQNLLISLLGITRARVN